MTKRSIRRTAGALAAATVAAAAATAAHAANGDIPIHQATTITQPGRYVVTRDIAAPGDAIVIQTGGVVLDLNGHTLAPGSGSGILIDLTGFSPWDVTIANGRIWGGDTGIRGVNLSSVVQVVVDKVGIVMPMFNCIDLPDSSLEVRGSYLKECGGDGIHMVGGGGGLVEVQDTLITGVRGSGIFAQTITGVTVRESTIRRFGTDPGANGRAGVWVSFVGNLSVLDSVVAEGQALGDGIRMTMGGASANRIVNTQVNANMGHGISLSGGAAHITGNSIVSNSLTGIHVDAAGIVTPSMISGNSILRNLTGGVNVLGGVVRFNGNTVGLNFGDGVSIAGTRALVENNMLQANLGAGLRFLNGNDHAYRGNFLRGNNDGGVQDAFNNTDAGGNIN